MCHKFSFKEKEWKKGRDEDDAEARVRERLAKLIARNGADFEHFGS